MKKILFFLLALCMSMPMMAKHVEKNVALKVAGTFMPGVVFSDISKTTVYNNLYIFTTENSFVIVSADDRIQPIVAYSYDSPFVVENMPDNILSWMNSLDAEIRYAIDNDIEPSKEISLEWDNLRNDVGLKTRNDDFVEPLVMTQWNQNAPYMNMCPGGSVAGCVAIAMAQVMKYWEWPHKGIGSHSYEENDYGTITVNFANTTYDWDNMIAKPTTSSTQAQQNAVATLVYHCGISVDMNYSPQGSGAYPSDLPNALKSYFDYNTELHDAYKEDYSDAEWKDLLKTELYANRPILYSGWDVNGAGHCFICDGYDKNDYFHFNWGWGGYCDGYYAIGLLNPGTGGIGSGSGVYNEYNYILLDVEPNTPAVAAPSVIIAETDGHNITINWSSVENAHHYKLYRNGFVINNNLNDTIFTDVELPYGLYKYQVRSVISEGDYSMLSDPAEATVSYEGPIPTNVTAVIHSGNDVKISWDSPENETATLKYGDGQPSGYPFGGNYNFYWGQRFTAEQLYEYAGMAMTLFQVYLSKTGTYNLMIYKEVNGNMYLQVSQSFNYNGNGSWKTVALANPLVVDYSNNIVVMLHNNTVDLPAVYMNYDGSENACLYSYDGSTFNTMYGTSWLFRTILSDGTYTYNVYRNGNEIVSNLTGKEYIDENLELGTYEYTIKTNYYCGLSEPSEPVTITIAEDLSLEVIEIYGPSCDGCCDAYIVVEADGGVPPYIYTLEMQSSEATNNSYTFDNICAGYYTIEVNDSSGLHASVSVDIENPIDIDENNEIVINIFPNPTDGALSVICNNMENITIFTTTGQIMCYMDVNDDNAIIDMQNYSQGLYVLMIRKDDGTMIRRNIVRN